MENNEQHFMRKAIELSKNNILQQGGGPFGAVIVKDGKIIASGVNQVTTSNDPTAHAEVVAIRNACKAIEDFSLQGCIIYTSCEPCPMCLSAIYWARIDRIVFANNRQDAAAIGFDDEFLYQEIPLALEDRTIPVAQMLRDEALETFRLWESDEDKTEY